MIHVSRFIFFIVITAFLGICFNVKANENNADPNNCISCHESSYADWQKSDHAKAMEVPSKQTVKGNFNNTTVKHYGQKATFFIKNEQYQVTISYDEKVETLPIKYTFGHYPLQQYLVETEAGRLQVLPFAWDSRAKDDGGQRWYHNYSHEEIKPEDRLHWRQPLQNWNGMCADCHSDGLKRNYNTENNTFKTTWDNINVGCVSCHGKQEDHFANMKKSPKKYQVNPMESLAGQWVRELGEKTAHWQGDKRDNSFMDSCFACHSLRTPLSDGFVKDKAFLDQFNPQVIQTPWYHVDGQIRDEVYVYGSFLQSKMYKNGVNCIDCHDKHTMKVKAQNNGLCLQCHAQEAFDNKKHHGHEKSSTGAQCVNCHMPTNRYMGVDDRRDHSFKIPRPDLSLKHDTPNACVQCHEGNTNQWAADTLIEWHGQPKALSKSLATFIQLQSGDAVDLEDHLALIADEAFDVIRRASAIQLLNVTTQTMSVALLTPYLQHKEPLIRIAAGYAALLISPNERYKALAPLLDDPFASVRLTAANALIDANLPVKENELLKKAFIELFKSNEINTWRGEGHANQAMLLTRQQNVTQAEQEYINSINKDPYFEAAYVNLAELYRQQQRLPQEIAVLSKAISRLSNSAMINYIYALHLVRQKKYDQALNFFAQAVVLEPSSEQYIYAQVLSLDTIGKPQQALQMLQKNIKNAASVAQLKELGLYLSQKTNNREAYNWFQAY